MTEQADPNQNSSGPHTAKSILLIALMFLLGTLLSVAVSSAQEQLISRDHAPGSIEFKKNQQWLTGLRLIDSATETLIMGRDGWLHTIQGDQRQTHMRVSQETYSVASAAEMRHALRTEFGSRFEVVATKNFLVVQPVGRGERWPELFETAHRAFVRFMQRRGVITRQGRFPMVAVVYPDAPEMFTEFQRLGINVSRVAGLYANQCNRVMTHDGGHVDSVTATVRHEAAHQSAFNLGVHSRVNDTPSWITEGIGQMFEPATQGGDERAEHVRDRVNTESLQYIRSHFSTHDQTSLSGVVRNLIQGDETFRDPATIHESYAVAWAMMFYLSEREREQFVAILNHTAGRPPFASYLKEQRIADFQSLVDEDPLSFTIRMSRFLHSL